MFNSEYSQQYLWANNGPWVECGSRRIICLREDILDERQ